MNISYKVFVISIFAAVTIIFGNSVILPIFAQQNDNTNTTDIDYQNFHSNVEQIIGHIQMAEFNKNSGNDSLALAHTLHPIEEVFTLITLPLNDTDDTLNNTYANSLLSLPNLVVGDNNTNTSKEFETAISQAIGLSDKVIAKVIPDNVMENTNHNITVINDLLKLSSEEYAEGVQNGQIILLIEYQDASAFVNRAFSLFNNTIPIVNEREEIISLFKDVNVSIEQQKNSSEIDVLVNKLVHELSESLSDNSTMSISIEGEQTEQDYINNIRNLLNEATIAYSADNIAKTKELITAAYLNNFEHIEKSIGNDLSEDGEELLRKQLRAQIDNQSSEIEVNQTINEINAVLDKAVTILES